MDSSLGGATWSAAVILSSWHWRLWLCWPKCPQIIVNTWDFLVCSISMTLYKVVQKYVCASNIKICYLHLWTLRWKGNFAMINFQAWEDQDPRESILNLWWKEHCLWGFYRSNISREAQCFAEKHWKFPYKPVHVTWDYIWCPFYSESVC